MAENGGKGQGRLGAIVITVVIFQLPGGIFFAKGVVEVVDRYAGRIEREATLTETETSFTVSNGDSVTLYYVHGEIAGGEPFRVDDQRLYEIADGRTPLPVRVEVTRFSKRVVAVRSDFGSVDRIAGATQLWLATLALVLGGALSILPFVVQLKAGRVRAAEGGGEVQRTPDWIGFAIVCAAAVVIVGGTIAWDVLR